MMPLIKRNCLPAADGQQGSNYTCGPGRLHIAAVERIRHYDQRCRRGLARAGMAFLGTFQATAMSPLRSKQLRLQSPLPMLKAF
jgi:hypothetical protein